MCLNEICRDLTLVNETVSQWVAGEPVHEMDRDMVLEKLRTVYSSVKSVSAVCCGCEDAGGETGTAAPEPDVETEGADAGTPAPEPQVEAPGPAPVTDTETAVSDSEKKRRALLSLYEQETVTFTETARAGGDNGPSESERYPAVLGEALKNEGMTLADAYALTGKPHDISSEIGAGRVETLSGSIGLNDRFMIVRDLFGGDAGAYDEAMSVLESFDDLGDAMVHIYENYTWDPDSEGVAMLVDLLTRKLS